MSYVPLDSPDTSGSTTSRMDKVFLYDPKATLGSVPAPSAVLINQQESFDGRQTTSAPQSQNDFSFLSSRPLAPCSALANAITRPRRSNSLGQAANSRTPITPSRPAKSSTSATFALPALPTSLRKRSRNEEGAPSPKSVKKVSTGTARPNKPHLLKVDRIPLQLPKPPIVRISDPYDDVIAHLRRHGYEDAADQHEHGSDITVEFFLEKWVRCVAPGGPVSLLKESDIFLNEDRCGPFIREQVSKAQIANERLPKLFNVPMESLTRFQAEGILPDRMLAIYGRDADEKGLLIPAHTILYIMQCVTLPSFASKVVEEQGFHTMAVTPVRVPSPKTFATVHRFVYTHDCASLLSDILPMRFLSRYCEHQEAHGASLATEALLASLSNLSQPVSINESAFADQFIAMLANNEKHNPKPLPLQAVEALSQLASGSLLQIAFKIRSIYANGVAIGFMEVTFWLTLQKAWALVVAALGLKRCRSLAAESRSNAAQSGSA